MRVIGAIENIIILIMAKASLENISSLSCIRETTGQRSLEAILQYEKQFSIHSIESLVMNTLYSWRCSENLLTDCCLNKMHVHMTCEKYEIIRHKLKLKIVTGFKVGNYRL